MPWIDEKSNLLTLFGDLTFRTSSNEITYALDNLNSEGTQVRALINDLTNVAAVSDRIDIVSAHRVMGQMVQRIQKI